MRLSRRSMRSRATQLIGLASLTGMGSCGVETSSNTAPPPIPAQVDRLAAWMTGSFEASPPLKVDPGFQDLHINACRIWPERLDGRWIYLEQAKKAAVDVPQRQQILCLKVDDQGWLISELFAFPAGMAPDAQAWKDPSSLNRIDPALLSPLEGCTVFFDDDGREFKGGTRGRGCEGDAGDGTYATTELMVEATSFSRWDRTYDEQGRQVSGPRSGPIVFIRR